MLQNKVQFLVWTFFKSNRWSITFQSCSSVNNNKTWAWAYCLQVSEKVKRRPNQKLDLNPEEHLCRELKMTDLICLSINVSAKKIEKDFQETCGPKVWEIFQEDLRLSLLNPFFTQMQQKTVFALWLWSS